MWCPPTPPQELSDVYIDLNLGMLYEEEPLKEADLPPIYVRKDLKRSRVAEIPSNLEIRRMKISRREDSPLTAPRSLFDHPGSAIQKMKRDVKLKYRTAVPYGAHNPARVAPPVTREEGNFPEWCIQEEFVLLQTIEVIQDLPLTLITSKPGHTPNWDLAADMVNKVSCTIRSASQCRNRFENYIIYREEGKLAIEYKRQKKTKNNYRPPIQKNFSTKRLNQQDNNKNFTDAYNQRFDNIKTCAHSRKPNPKPLLSNSQNKPKHLAVILDSGVNYDCPLAPMEIAQRRADRIAKEKTKQPQAQNTAAQTGQAAPVATSAAAAASTSTPAHTIAAEQLTQQQRQLVVQTQTAAATAKAVHNSSIAIPTATVNVAVTLANNVLAATPVAAAVATTAAPTATQSASQTANIVVAAAAAASGGALLSTLPSLPPALRQARPVSTIPIQDMVATVSQARPANATTTATVVSVSSLTPAQLQAARLASGSLVTIPATGVKVVTAGGNAMQVPTTSKTLSAAQLNYYKQQTLMRTNSQQRIGVRDQAQVKIVQGQTKVAQVAQVQAVAAAQGKNQFLKQASALTAKGRPDEMAVSAITKQQMQRKPNQSMITAQLLSQGALQVQHSTTTLVKTSGQNVVSIPTIAAMPQIKGTLTSQLKTAVASSQPMRLNLPSNYHQLIGKQTRPTKVTQLTKSMSGVPTQLIVQSQGNKTVTAHNMQQISHFMKPPNAQHITVSGVLAKAGTAGAGTLSQRVLPNVGGTRQTIQVVPGSIRGMSGVTQVSVPSAITGSLKMAGTSQQTFLSQMTGLQSIVRQGSMNPIRIQSSQTGPIVAVTMPQSQQNQQNADHNQGNS